VIRLDGLRVRAGDFSLAIDDLSISAGEYAIVFGPTAAGKTVLLETVAGLRGPREGRIWFGEREVTAEPPERRGAGLVYQDYVLFPHLTVAENITFGRVRRPAPPGRPAGERIAVGRGRRADRPEVRELAALLGIEGLLKRYPEGLSGGEQQRVALARALATRPEVLLLDEPLSALDGPTRLELRRELKRLHEGLGATVLHVTHDLDEALALGQKVAVLIGGELRQVGTPEGVARSPVDVAVARLVKSANLFAVATVETASSAPRASRRIVLENGLGLSAGTGQALGHADRVYAAIRADEITLEPWEPAGGAARAAASENVLDGRVSAIQIQSAYVVVEVRLTPSAEGAAAAGGAQPEAGTAFAVHVSRAELERNGLMVGTPVRMLIPPTSVHLCAGAPSRPVVS